MNDAYLQGPDIFTTLGHEHLQPFLERCSAIMMSPLWLVDPAGAIVASLHAKTVAEAEAFRFAIVPETSQVSPACRHPAYPTARPLAAPLRFQDEIAGFLVALSHETTAQEDQAILKRLAFGADLISEKAYSEYELQNLTEELIEKYNEVNLIYDISEALGAVLDEKTVCQVILEKAVGVIGVGRASVMLYDEQADRLYIVAAHGFHLSEEELRHIVVAPGDGVSGKVFASGKHLLIEDASDAFFADDLAEKPRNYRHVSFLSVPLVCTLRHTEQKVMGVINMTDKHSSDAFTSGDLRLLTAVASQAAMSLYNIQLIEEVKDAERVKREMEIAQQIQMGLLPAKPPQLLGIELAGRCLPATQVGGDYYDFFLSVDHKLGLVIADVSGHNIGAALMMAVARSTLRSEVLTRKSPADILKNTNLILYDDLTHAELFITMFYAEYDVPKRLLRYSNGGHNHPIVLRDGACVFLDTDGMLIGMLERVDFEEKIMLLQPEDFVIFYTDGVVEAANDDDGMFKLERLCRVIEAHGHCNADELLESIYDALAAYSGSTVRSDDMTVVVLKIH